ncbi:MAG: decaprenyl-phosphate phosphoribosyltransferase [Anaerolineales bacterium]|nr:decaprenyl-phosphate phosphoribosyltransferase [Anaerolineales bacterium]
MVKALTRAMRPRQWTKNVFVFAALVFDGQLFEPVPLLRTIAGFILLCLISSAVYLINDIADVERDKEHPTKKNRPIASGELSIRVAAVAAALFAICSLAVGFALSWFFGIILLLYFVINLLYSFGLKHVLIIDVFIVAAGFVLRVGAGVSLITVERFSPWLYVCTTLLALIVGFGKRRAEIVTLAGNANAHRRVLDGYTIPYLDTLIVIISAVTIMAYSLYTFSAENLPDNDSMMLTIPFVLYGIFRYIYLLQVKNEGGAPEELFLRDRPIQITLLLWGLLSILILYFG